MTHTDRLVRDSNGKPTRPRADFDHGEVAEVALLLRASDVAELEARATRNGMTAGQLPRQVIRSYLTADEEPWRVPILNHHGEAT